MSGYQDSFLNRFFQIKISLLFEHKCYPDNNWSYQLLKYMIRMNRLIIQKRCFLERSIMETILWNAGMEKTGGQRSDAGLWLFKYLRMSADSS